MAISPVRLSLKTVIPAKSSGRLVDALTDVISPFTEWMGLKGDLIRLHREDVAFKVALKAAQRLSLEKKPITPVPLKALVPLLERASLEDAADATMIEMWANLLASAAMGAQSSVPRYVSILSEINGRQARLIQSIITKRSRRKVKLRGELLLDHLWGMDEAGVIQRLQQEITSEKVTPQRIISVIKKYVDYYGVALSDISVGQHEDQWDHGLGLFPVEDNRIDIETLESLNLLKDATFKNVPFYKYDVSVFFYRVTPLCIDMFSACNPDLLERRTVDVPTPTSKASNKRRGTRKAMHPPAG